MTKILKYAVATPRDVIAHAFARSPLVFIIKMQHLAKLHTTAAGSMKSRLSREAAYDLAMACMEVSDLLSDLGVHHLDTIMSEQRLWIPAYGAACDLLDVPRLARHDIVVRYEASKLAPPKS